MKNNIQFMFGAKKNSYQPLIIVNLILLEGSDGAGLPRLRPLFFLWFWAVVDDSLLWIAPVSTSSADRATIGMLETTPLEGGALKGASESGALEPLSEGDALEGTTEGGFSMLPSTSFLALGEDDWNFLVTCLYHWNFLLASLCAAYFCPTSHITYMMRKTVN